MVKDIVPVSELDELRDPVVRQVYSVPHFATAARNLLDWQQRISFAYQRESSAPVHMGQNRLEIGEYTLGSRGSVPLYTGPGIIGHYHRHPLPTPHSDTDLLQFLQADEEVISGVITNQDHYLLVKPWEFERNSNILAEWNRYNLAAAPDLNWFQGMRFRTKIWSNLGVRLPLDSFKCIEYVSNMARFCGLRFLKGDLNSDKLEEVKLKK